jgi:hypothetical protein
MQKSVTHRSLFLANSIQPESPTLLKTHYNTILQSAPGLPGDPFVSNTQTQTLCPMIIISVPHSGVKVRRMGEWRHRSTVLEVKTTSSGQVHVPAALTPVPQTSTPSLYRKRPGNSNSILLNLNMLCGCVLFCVSSGLVRGQITSLKSPTVSL